MPNLPRAIQNLYTTFARYPLRAEVPFCDHCHDAGEVALLRRVPLHSLAPRDLNHIAFDLVTTFGELPELKHLLPRVYELMAAGANDLGFDPYVQAGKLQLTFWRTWPQPEQEALSAFWRELFRARVMQAWPSDTDGLHPAHVLAAMARAEMDIAPELDHWTHAQHANATLWLAEACVAIGPDVSLGPTWDEAPEAAAQFQLFLRNADHLNRLQSAYFETKDAAAQQLLSEAHQILATRT